MKLTFLGTSSAAPTRKRNVAAIALQFDQTSAWWLFDCGEGTQHQIQRTPLRLGRLERIFLTHLHGDHLFGLPGLMASRSLQDGAESPVALVGPPGLEGYLRASFTVSGTRLGYPWTVDTVRPAPQSSRSKMSFHTVYTGENMRVACGLLDHGAASFGYRIVEHERPGRLDADRLASIGVPAGPVYKRLKNKETVNLPDGRVLDGREFLGPEIAGRTVVICGDTMRSDHAVALAQGADVLVHEATFSEEDRDLADRARHSTAADAARVAAQAGVGLLILTHVSPRYDDVSQPNPLLGEALAIFPDTLLAEDLWTYEVASRPTPSGKEVIHDET